MAARKRQAKVDGLGDLVHDLPPTRPAALKRIMDILVDAALAHLEWQNACQKGIDALNSIDNTLAKYGKNLSADQVKQLKEAGESLWESLVRLGCPV